MQEHSSSRNRPCTHCTLHRTARVDGRAGTQLAAPGPRAAPHRPQMCMGWTTAARIGLSGMEPCRAPKCCLIGHLWFDLVVERSQLGFAQGHGAGGRGMMAKESTSGSYYCLPPVIPEPKGARSDFTFKCPAQLRVWQSQRLVSASWTTTCCAHSTHCAPSVS